MTFRSGSLSWKACSRKRTMASRWRVSEFPQSAMARGANGTNRANSSWTAKM